MKPWYTIRRTLVRAQKEPFDLSTTTFVVTKYDTKKSHWWSPRRGWAVWSVECATEQEARQRIQDNVGYPRVLQTALFNHEGKEENQF